jgi:hypothetical protein
MVMQQCYVTLSTTEICYLMELILLSLHIILKEYLDLVVHLVIDILAQEAEYKSPFRRMQARRAIQLVEHEHTTIDMPCLQQ